MRSTFSTLALDISQTLSTWQVVRTSLDRSQRVLIMPPMALSECRVCLSVLPHVVRDCACGTRLCEDHNTLRAVASATYFGWVFSDTVLFPAYPNRRFVNANDILLFGWLPDMAALRQYTGRGDTAHGRPSRELQKSLKKYFDNGIYLVLADWKRWWPLALLRPRRQWTAKTSGNAYGRIEKTLRKAGRKEQSTERASWINEQSGRQKFSEWQLLFVEKR